MSVITEVNKVDYLGDGASTGPFDFAFKVFANTDLEVYVAGVLKTLTTHYTVALVSDGQGGYTGSVTFVTAPANLAEVLIRRQLDLTQPTVLPIEGALPAKTVEKAIDRNTLLIQQVQEETGRTIKLPVTFLGTFDNELPTSVTANKALVVNSAGDGWAFSADDYEDQAADAAASAVAAAASAVTAAASASSASTSAGTATTQAAAAAASAAAAAASAAGLALPSFSGGALKFLRVNAAANAWELATVSAIDALTRRLLFGRAPYYTDANTITIPAYSGGIDSTGAYVLASSSNITVALNVSGAGGLDTSTEASNTWYYVYMIGKTDGTVSAVFSVTNESVSGSITLPSGYTLKRQLPLAVRNNGSSNILQFVVAGGWPHQPVVLYNLPLSVHAGGATTAGTANLVSAGTAASMSTLTATSFVPPCSRIALCNALATFANSAYGRVREASGLSEQMVAGPAGTMTQWLQPVTSGQQFDYYRASGTGSLSIDVAGFVVTEI